MSRRLRGRLTRLERDGARLLAGCPSCAEALRTTHIRFGGCAAPTSGMATAFANGRCPDCGATERDASPAGAARLLEVRVGGATVRVVDLDTGQELSAPA